jgi:hypothetical protein
MLQLRVYEAAASLEAVGRSLGVRAVRGVVIAQAVRPGEAVLTAEVRPEAADTVLTAVAERGVAAEDVVLVRLDDVVPFKGRRADSLIWADVLSQAAAHSRPVARYLTFMVAAGLIAGFGVIEVNSILSWEPRR